MHFSFICGGGLVGLGELGSVQDATCSSTPFGSYQAPKSGPEDNSGLGLRAERAAQGVSKAINFVLQHTTQSSGPGTWFPLDP